MSERSILRVAPRQHADPDRKGEWIIEVWRNGEIVAHVYGTREGVQVVSPRVKQNSYFYFEAASPSVVVPLLAENEVCPWCDGTHIFLGGPCAVCAARGIDAKSA